MEDPETPPRTFPAAAVGQIPPEWAVKWNDSLRPSQDSCISPRLSAFLTTPPESSMQARFESGATGTSVGACAGGVHAAGASGNDAESGAADDVAAEGSSTCRRRGPRKFTSRPSWLSSLPCVVGTHGDGPARYCTLHVAAWAAHALTQALRV